MTLTKVWTLRQLQWKPFQPYILLLLLHQWSSFQAEIGDPFFSETYSFISWSLAFQSSLFTRDLIRPSCNIPPVSRVFLSFLAFIFSKDRQVNQGEEEFPTIDAKNNTDEVEKPTENTGDTSNNLIIIVLER